MHYQHLFHAGNFADVFKHVLLIGLLEALSRKDKPWCYLDTHAGAGGYNLASLAASRTGEWPDGVGRLRAEPAQPEWVARYLALLGWDATDAQTLAHSRPYPGSPQIAQQLARAGDRVVCCESQPDIAQQIRAYAPGAELHVRDGYQAHGLLPPREKRGLVLIDPPFEARDEFERIGAFLEQAQLRFATGVYAAWYPLKNRHEATRFERRAARGRAHVICRLDTGAPGEGQMRGCGLLVINPPYGFDAQARSTLAWLAPRLAQGPRPAWSVEQAGAKP